MDWLAGFLEGEGSFGCYSNGRRICIQAAQVQRWPLDKAQALAGGIVRGPYQLNQHRHGQPIYHWSHDRGPATLDLMRRLHPLMSPGRQAQIDKAIEAYLAVPHPGSGWRRKVAAVAILVLTLSGCATAKDAFTNPTGNITIPRQQFVNTYALVKVMWKSLRENAELACATAPAGEVGPCFAKLRDIDSQAKALSFQIEAKIAVPESEIDWAVVMGLLKAVIGLIP